MICEFKITTFQQKLIGKHHRDAPLIDVRVPIDYTTFQLFPGTGGISGLIQAIERQQIHQQK